MSELLIVILHLGCHQQFLTQAVPFLLGELVKRLEIGLVILHDGLVYQHVLNLGRERIAFEYQEYQRFQEVLLLPEVQVIFLFRYLEGIHGNGLLLGVADISALVVTTDAFIGVSGIYHDHIGLLFQQLADNAVHVEALAAAAWSDTEEVGVVGHLDLAFLSCDVNTYRQSLTVGVVRGQRSLFRTFQMLLEEEAQCRIRECQEKVIVGIESVGIAGKAVREKFQLVVRAFGRYDATLVQLGLQIRSNRSYLVRRTAHQHIEVAIYQQRAVHGKTVKHLLDVRLGNLVAGVGHGAVPFRFALQLAEQLALFGNLHHLVENHTVREGHLRQEGEQVGGDGIAVDAHLRIGLDHGREVYLVDVHQRIGTDNPAPDFEIFVRCLEVGHGERAVPELERHEAVAILVDLLLGQQAVPDMLLGKHVVHLGDLGMEVQPFLGVILHKLAALRLLRDYQIGAYLRELSSLEVVEVAPGQELGIFRYLMVVALLAEDVLLLQRIAFPKRLQHAAQHLLKAHVLLRVRTQLLYGIGHFKND